MSKPKLLFIGVLGLAAAVLLGGIAFFSLRDSGPDALTLGERAEATDGSATDSSETDSAATGARNGVEGSWTVGADSVAGYRVVEDFAGGISDFEAVGRTSDVMGSLVIDGTSITEAEFSVQVATITSDDSRRDNQFRISIMKAGDFPEATFVLTSPIELGSVPADGETITVDATGELTLRDATVPVSFPIEARLQDGVIESLGSIPVVFSDYGIANPSFQLVSVRDEGVVEFSIFFE